MIPVGIAGGDPGAAGIDQAADNARIDLATDIKHQQIFLGRRGWRFTARIADELEMPCGIWPSGHQQRMTAFSRSAGPEQNVEAQAVNPEPLRCLQVMARARDTQVTCR